MKILNFIRAAFVFSLLYPIIINHVQTEFMSRHFYSSCLRWGREA
jgi:hypothetical protein